MVLFNIYSKQSIMTPEEYNQKIDIATRELAYSKTSEEKVTLNTKIQKLRYYREISIIRKKIEQLS